MNWAEAAAARLHIPLLGDLEGTHYPPPTRWGKCERCGSTTWSLAKCHNEAADAAAVHAAFCGGGR